MGYSATPLFPCGSATDWKCKTHLMSDCINEWSCKRYIYPNFICKRYFGKFSYSKIVRILSKADNIILMWNSGVHCQTLFSGGIRVLVRSWAYVAQGSVDCLHVLRCFCMVSTETCVVLVFSNVFA